MGISSFPPELADRYRPIETIGAGASAQVYRAHQLSLDRSVVIKIVHVPPDDTTNLVDRVLQEAEVLAGLTDPHIVSLLDHGQTSGSLYLVYPDEGGETLDRRSPPGQVLDSAEVVRVLTACLRALSAAQAKGILHRDLKPANILLTAAGDIRLIDFGLAKFDAQGPDLTATGVFVGTPLYASPQQAQGHPAEARDDLYSLGMVGYELLTGRHPFRGLALEAVFAAQIAAAIPPLRGAVPSIDPALATFIESLLQKQREDRPESAAEALAWLLRLDEATASTVSPEQTMAMPPAAAPPTEKVPAPARQAPLSSSSSSASPSDPTSQAHSLGILMVFGLVAGVALSRWAPPAPASAAEPPPVSAPVRTDRFLKLSAQVDRELVEIASLRVLKGGTLERVLDGSAPTARSILDGDPMRWDLALAQLTSLRPVTDWLNEGGRIEDLSAADRDALAAADARLVTAALPARFRPLLDARPRSPSQLSRTQLRQLNLTSKIFDGLRTEPLGPWASAMVASIRDALDQQEELVEGLDKIHRDAEAPGVPRGLAFKIPFRFDLDNGDKFDRNSARRWAMLARVDPGRRRKLATYFEPAGHALRLALEAAIRSLGSEPKTREQVAILMAQALDRLTLTFECRLGYLPLEAIFSRSPRSGPGLLLVAAYQRRVLEFRRDGMRYLAVEQSHTTDQDLIRLADAYQLAARAPAHGPMAPVRRLFALYGLFQRPMDGLGPAEVGRLYVSVSDLYEGLPPSVQIDAYMRLFSLVKRLDHDHPGMRPLTSALRSRSPQLRERHGASGTPFPASYELILRTDGSR